MRNLKTLAQELALSLLVLVSAQGIGTSDQAPSDKDFSTVDHRSISLAKAPAPEASADLAGAFAYPVPFMPSVGDKKIVFANVPAEALIEVRTLNGDLVKELKQTNGNGELAWDVRDSQGQSLASDVYPYTIRFAGQEKTGKIVVLK